MLYVFLDIDGVLNTKDDWNRPYSINRRCVDEFIRLMNSIKEDKSTIAISTWRMGDELTRVDRLLEKAGYPIVGKTPVSNKGRQAEIEYYIRRNNVKQYIIIDDDSSLYTDVTVLNIHFTDYTKGFTKEDTAKIRKLIKRGNHVFNDER